jgi:hypothetical protein
VKSEVKYVRKTFRTERLGVMLLILESKVLIRALGVDTQEHEYPQRAPLQDEGFRSSRARWMGVED